MDITSLTTDAIKSGSSSNNPINWVSISKRVNRVTGKISKSPGIVVPTVTDTIPTELSSLYNLDGGSGSEYVPPGSGSDVPGWSGSETLDGSGSGSENVSDVYHTYVKKLTYDGYQSFRWDFISNSLDTYSAYMYVGMSAFDARGLQVMNGLGQWVSPDGVVSGGQIGDNSVTLHYPTSFGNSALLHKWRATNLMNMGILFNSQIPGSGGFTGRFMWLSLPQYGSWNKFSFTVSATVVAELQAQYLDAGIELPLGANDLELQPEQL